MGCCIAIALVIALVRKAWFALVPGGAPPDPMFAPPARRNADGSPVATRVPVVDAVAPASRGAICLGAAAVTTALYAGVVAVLRWTGAAESLPGAAVSWPVRDVVVGLIGAALIVAAAVRYRGGRPRGSRAPVLFGAGAAWFGLGVLDMHVLGVVHLGHSVTSDVLFHGPGLLAMTLGAGAFAAELRRQAAADLAVVAR